MIRPSLRKQIAARCIKLRDGREIKDYAPICDIEPSNMYKLEAGLQGYEIETIANICEGNNITLCQFFEGMVLERQIANR
jgi:hypothetical protein